MDKWQGKVAVVTGASAGIGAALVKDLVKAGVITIGLARRVEKIEALREDLEDNAENLHAYECDISDESSVKSAFQWVEETFGGLQILVNNAGCGMSKLLLQTDPDPTEDIRRVIDTNVYGFLYATREAFRIMSASDEEAYIVNISSVLGHITPYIPGLPPFTNIYSGTKYSMTATSEVFRQEINYLKKNNIRVTQISPGYVKTEFQASAGLDLPEEYAESPSLIAEDISDAILYVLGTPSRVQIKEMIVKPNGEFL